MSNGAATSNEAGHHTFMQLPDSAALGCAMHDLMRQLYPINRSITGDGMRQSLAIIQGLIPITVHSIPSGTPALDWEVPREWNLRAAWIKNENGQRIVDLHDSTLHVVGYSVPVHATLPLADLKQHLYTLPEHPGWIPYRTSYYSERWGFCITEEQLQGMHNGAYEVCVDSALEPGVLNYGELYIPGESDDEILFSTHCCHPSLCNDNLSGMALTTHLAQQVLAMPRRRYTYRFLFIPGTIGSIAWLATHDEAVSKIRHGLVVACVGDAGKMHYKRSRQGNAEIDRAVLRVLADRGQPHAVRDFAPYGYDERQYCSPGYNLAIGSLTRTPHGEFPEYHTSADNLDFVRPDALADSLECYRQVIDVLENNRRYTNTVAKGEPQLGRRGLYRTMGGFADAEQRQMAYLWLLNLADGDATLLDIAERSALPFNLLHECARALLDAGLLIESQ